MNFQPSVDREHQFSRVDSGNYRNILTTEEAAKYCGYSTSRWRYLYGAGLAPSPLKLSARKNGWKIETLDSWLDSKADA
jgi:predicted DNA-binding transcriptional regulator AlpA